MALSPDGKALIEPEDHQLAGSLAQNQSDRDIAFPGQVVINCGILARRRKRMGGKARKKQIRIRRLGPAETSAVLCSAGD
jgi:hypothetical protein